MRTVGLYCVLLSVIFTSCSLDTSKIEAQATALLQEKKSKYFKERHDKCLRELSIEAQTIADSILKSISKSIKFDSLKVPIDTLRPEKPNIDFPEYIKPEKSKK